MIYVALGTHERPFYRLVKEIERLIKEKKIKEEFIIQLGFTDYLVNGARCYKYLKISDLEKYINKCSVMITHGGLGSIMAGIEAGKPVIAVPRRKMFNEHTDDHQLQIVKEAKRYGVVIPIYDIEDLEGAIKKAKTLKVKKRKYKAVKILKIVERTLRKWEGF